ncbi:transmembrane protein 176B-like isoform X2 [Python bivittatus]|uniref:Transmembrane protein 176B-like isoform X2 n=1 Tax=Python bivittatus TaxID=176946 RepID=A0A9F5J9N8_PYTBI|nr:transmembrane protein 176B-like isoform X2 [Python bivittatus]
MPAGHLRRGGGEERQLHRGAKRGCPRALAASLSLQLAGEEGGEAMSGTALRVNGTEVDLQGSDKTVVNINLRQESSLFYLCKGMAALSRRKAASKAQEPADAPPTRARRRGEQKVLGGAQILLGAVCIGLGVVLSLVLEIPYDYERAIWNGAPFWMGSLFILSGTFSVVGERRGGKWVHLATFLNLASVVAGSLALTLGVADISSLTYRPYFIENLCKHRREEERYRSWDATTGPPYSGERDQERAKECQEVMWVLMCMLNGVRILLLVLSIAALCIALFCFGYGLHRLCCSCWEGWQDYVALEDPEASPVPEEPGKEENPA